ncbi:MAG: hypothetical protein K0R99_2586 [Microbacterium sp.]|jgi:hypothetical protein|uniref:hypothetical protein n=1 Tax=Microbacterium sp. TaxID=51671 RepID=UPI00262828E2|nr:hypothetical protein [Microbacterium sp.]MDF2561140.1 hypothetical protein [Microbacterium sp.]
MRIDTHRPLSDARQGTATAARPASAPFAWLTVAAVLLMSGCSSGGGRAPTSVADACATLSTAVGEISEAVHTALSTARNPAEVQADLEGYAERVDALAQQAENPDVTVALADLSSKLGETAEASGKVPTDAAGDLDPDALAEQHTEIEESIEQINAVCSDQSGPTDG